MDTLDLTSGLIRPRLPAPPADSVQPNHGDWDLSGLTVGCSFIQGYIDWKFEGEYSFTTLEWVDLKQLSFKTRGKDWKNLETLKPIKVEEETSSMGRKALMIVEDNYVCHDLNIRGHGHVLAVVRKYEHNPPPMPEGVTEEDLRDMCLRWYWTPKIRQAIQRKCNSAEAFTSCSEGFAEKNGSYLPMICVKINSLLDVEETAPQAKVWITHAAVDHKNNDPDEDPFGTVENVSLLVDVETQQMKKAVKGRTDDVSQQVKVILSCFP